MPAGKLFMVSKGKQSKAKSTKRFSTSKATKKGLTKTQISAVKKLVSEDIAVKDTFNDQITLTNTYALVPASPTGNAFFSLSNVQNVVGTHTQPSERSGDSIRALNMDLKIHTVFPGSKQNQRVRYLLIQWQDVDGASISQVYPNAYDNHQPYVVIDGNRVRNPDVKYKILADRTVTYNPINDGTNVIGKSIRIVHKFKPNESKMSYVPGYNQGTGPQTGTVQLFAVYAYPRMVNGSTYPSLAAPHISLSCRQRYMK